MSSKYYLTSESVTEGHPDKVCDQISDGILDAILAQDPFARVACETCAKSNFVLVMGEITTTAKVDIEAIARKVILEIGYDKDEYLFNGHNCEIMVKVEEQSPHISMGVDKSLEEKAGEGTGMLGAGDQGMMIGYATDETSEYMPFALALAHKLAKQLTKVRKDKVLDYLRPDGKTQVTVEYDEDGNVARIEALVLSTQHDPDIEHSKLEEDIHREVFDKIVPKELLDENTKYFINPTGQFVIGGPAGDSGLTGRKIIVDTYGGVAAHGGGAFSGKDSTKVDRTAAYAARHIAKNLVAAGLCKRCQIQLSYAIGVAHPMSIHIDTYGTSSLPEAELVAMVRKHFDLTPSGMIKDLDLRKPIFLPTASYGHFGRDDIDLSWERLDKVDLLKAYIK